MKKLASNRLNLLGQKFGKLEVIAEIPNHKRTRWLCRCECGNLHEATGSNLKYGSIKSCGCLHCKKKVKIGQRYGMLKVISKIDKKYKYGGVHWYCKCDCGNMTECSSGRLAAGQKKSCGCSSKWISKRAKNYKGYGKISGSLWSQIKRNASKRSFSFDITIEDAWNQFLEQNGKCALSGLPLTFRKFSRSSDPNSYRYLIKSAKKDYLQTASLDRIDSSIGYIKDNIQWVYKDINSIKRNMNEKLLSDLCEKITNRQKFQKSGELFRYIEPQRHHYFTGYKGIAGGLWSRIKRSALKRKIMFDLDIQDAWKIYEKQNGLCALTGEPITYYKNKKNRGTMSLDRIDSSKGYTKENVQWVHKNVNLMKWYFDQEYFIRLCKSISGHQKTHR